MGINYKPTLVVVKECRHHKVAAAHFLIQMGAVIYAVFKFNLPSIKYRPHRLG